MANYKCHVTGSNSNRRLAAAKAPVYCDNDKSKCVKGAKQMIAWNRTFIFLFYLLRFIEIYVLTYITEASGNNVQVPNGASPGYNTGMGWTPGAQTDIFQ